MRNKLQTSREKTKKFWSLIKSLTRKPQKSPDISGEQWYDYFNELLKRGVLGWLLVVVLFAPIRGGSLGICFVCWMLLRHCTEALVYSNHPRAAAASSYLAIIFGRIASGLPWFLRSTAEPMQHPHQCWSWCRPWWPWVTGNSVFDIRSLTWDEWSYPEGVILPIVTLGTIRPEDSGAARNATSFIIKLYSETQVSGRLGMSGGISPRHAQNPLSGERRKTLSITHHALSPPPSHHHLYIIHLINWLQRFYRIIMSLKRPFVPKSDVKQWFATCLLLKRKVDVKETEMQWTRYIL